jgi:hypothetical protein
MMARNLVIDADGHCYEPDSELAKWMPKELAHLAPNRVTDSSGYSHLMIEGRLAGHGVGAAVRIAVKCSRHISSAAVPA